MGCPSLSGQPIIIEVEIFFVLYCSPTLCSDPASGIAESGEHNDAADPLASHHTTKVAIRIESTRCVMTRETKWAWESEQLPNPREQKQHSKNHAVQHARPV